MKLQQRTSKYVFSHSLSKKRFECWKQCISCSKHPSSRRKKNPPGRFVWNMKVVLQLCLHAWNKYKTIALWRRKRPWRKSRKLIAALLIHKVVLFFRAASFLWTNQCLVHRVVPLYITRVFGWIFYINDPFTYVTF